MKTKWPYIFTSAEKNSFRGQIGAYTHHRAAVHLILFIVQSWQNNGWLQDNPEYQKSTSAWKGHHVYKASSNCYINCLVYTIKIPMWTNFCVFVIFTNFTSQTSFMIKKARLKIPVNHTMCTMGGLQHETLSHMTLSKHASSMKLTHIRNMNIACMYCRGLIHRINSTNISWAVLLFSDREGAHSVTLWTASYIPRTKTYNWWNLDSFIIT